MDQDPETSLCLMWVNNTHLWCIATSGSALELNGCIWRTPEIENHPDLLVQDQIEWVKSATIGLSWR
jgi:hypothetical protein